MSSSIKPTSSIFNPPLDFDYPSRTSLESTARMDKLGRLRQLVILMLESNRQHVDVQEPSLPRRRKEVIHVDCTDSPRFFMQPNKPLTQIHKSIHPLLDSRKLAASTARGSGSSRSRAFGRRD